MSSYKLHTIDNIESFSVSEDNLVLVRKDKIILNGQMLQETPNQEAAFYNTGFFVNTDLLIYGNNESYVRLNLKENKKHPLNPRWIYHWDTLQHEQVLVCSNRRKTDEGRRVADYFLYDFKKQALKDLGLTESPNSYHHQGISFMIDQNQSIRAFDVGALKFLWEVNLGQRGRELYEGKTVRIRQIIGIYQKNFLLSLTNDEIISVDMDSGNVLWHTTNFAQQHLSDWRNRSTFTFFYWHLENGILYQLDGNRFISMDVNNRTVKVLWEDTAEKDYLTIIHKTYTPSYIYFTASRNYALSPNLVGVFNRDTRKLDWINSVDNLKGSLNQPPQGSGNKLYVKDTGSALHIFERNNGIRAGR